MRLKKSDFRSKAYGQSYYDILDDYDIITASFAKQYGIRLSHEPNMTWKEFIVLLGGIMHDTPLGNLVSIRSESDKDMLKAFTPAQRAIRAEWQRKQASSGHCGDIDNLQGMLARTFGKE